MNVNCKMSNRVERYLEDAALRMMELRNVRKVTTDILIIELINSAQSKLNHFLILNYPEFEEEALNYDIIMASTLNEEFVDNFYNLKDHNYIYSKEVIKVLEDAYKLATKKGLKEVDETALTVALVQFKSKYWSYLKDTYDIDIVEIRQHFSISKYLNNEIKEIDQEVMLSARDNYIENFLGEGYNSTSPKNDKMFELMNDKVDKKKRNIICGRNDEIKKVFNLLQKMTVRGVILKGPSGVGKTAIVEGITERIEKGQCPDEFKGKKVYRLDFEGLMENTKYVGQFEEKVKSLKEFLLSQNNVILFIDEIHNIIGAGRSANSSYDLANGLKPILTDGKVQIIGATTDEEYKKYFSFDGALRRRFQIVEVEEPKIKELKRMLSGKVRQLEEFHKVKVPERSFEYAVMEASKYNFNTANPARTVDILDNAMVIAKNKKKEELEEEDILEVHKENVKDFKKMSKKDVEQIAYHETGHYILNKALKGNSNKVELVTIIPADDYLGANIIIEKRHKYQIKTKQFYINEIAELLAGEKAMLLNGFYANSGKSDDLMRASKIARNMVLEFGMFSQNTDILGNYNSYVENERIELEYLSDKQKEELTKQVDIILEEGYNLAEKVLKRKKKQLDIIAKALIKAGSLDSNQLTGLYSGKLNLEDIPKL